MRIGYARVSALDQTLALQRDAHKEAGCEKVFADHGVSGTGTTRPGLDRAPAPVIHSYGASWIFSQMLVDSESA